MDYFTIILTVVSVVLAIAGWKFLQIEWKKISENQNEDSKWMIVYAVVLAVLNISVVMMMKYVYPEHAFDRTLRDLILLSLVWITAATDFKFHIIPNTVILTGVGFWTAFTLVNIIWFGEIWFQSFLSEMIAAGITMLCVGICLLIMKNSIAEGDIKLLLLVCVLLGTVGMIESVFIAMILSFIISIFLLISKRKERKDVIPFAPFMLGGLYIGIIFMGI